MTHSFTLSLERNPFSRSNYSLATSHLLSFLSLLFYSVSNLTKSLSACNSRQTSRPSIPNASSSSTSGDTGRRGSDSGSIGSNDLPGGVSGGFTQQVEQTAQQLKGLIRRASQVTSEDVGGIKSTATDGTTGLTQSEEDTMKNLRKTFAGIFGDM